MASSSQSAASSSTAIRRIGRYAVFEEFARGGMASVHLGRLIGPAGFSRVVAVKRVRAVFVDSEEHRRALLAEAKIASRVRHPNVVQTLDIVIEGAVAFVVMEYVHGVTAAELMAEARLRGERAPVGIAIGVVADALQGLHAAHEARDPGGSLLGIVHRDVSPQNIHVDVDGRARLLDFGVAKALDRTQTGPGVVKGKLAYMSREQLSGMPVTRQVDVYGAGVVLWELLAGRRLFDGGDAAHLAGRILTETIPPPSLHAPGVPPEVDGVVLRATDPDPRKRYETAAEMLAALTSAAPRAEASEIAGWVERLAGDQLELRAESVKRAETVEMGEAVTQIAPSPVGEAAGAHPRRRLVAACVVAGLAVVVGGAFAAARPRAAKVAEVAAAAPEAASTTTPIEPPVPAPTPTGPPIAVATPLASAIPAHAKAPRRRASCDPPFSIDSNGTKIYKAECLR